jgi:MFS family permease
LHLFSDQSPVMAVLLSGPYWVMHRWGITFERSPILAEYLLTVFGVTLPIALAAGLLYRMGRIFELKRPARAGLALAVVIGSGWISYATVLSSGAAAAALVVVSAACLVQATLTKRRGAGLAWIFFGGFCAALAATYELSGLAFLVFLVLVVTALRWPIAARMGALALYLIGAALPLLLYAGLNRPITGDLRPGFLHPELSTGVADVTDASHLDVGAHWADEEDGPPTIWGSTERNCERFLIAFFGGHGLLTHFPVLLIGLAGMSMVMHRHWPMTTKLLACATILAALGIVVGFILQPGDWADAMFANRWFLVFLPLTLFWAGAWLRRSHHPATWAAACALWGISAIIALLGATDPEPRQGYDRYTAAAAFMHLVQPSHPPTQREMVAQE